MSMYATAEFAVALLTWTPRWDSLTGRKTSSSTSPTGAPASSPAAPATESPTTPSTSFVADDTFDSPGSTPVPAFLNDPSLLNPLATSAAEKLEYLTLDDSVLSDLPGSQSAIPSRGWSDDLCYGTGCTYLLALSTGRIGLDGVASPLMYLGGAWGFAEGLRRAPAGAPPRLKLNSILNGVTRRGPFLGNSAGVVAMGYNGWRSNLM
jgi:import inner membrane translocase subunit TIM23